MKPETIDLLDMLWVILMVLIFFFGVCVVLSIAVTEVEIYELLHQKQEANECNKAFRTSDGE
jgi:CBS domain containing-hemolysin-like protein